MTQKEFDKLVKQLNDYSYDIMANKRPEYTNEDEDVLNNFKSTADRLNTSALKVWATFFEKQIQNLDLTGLELRKPKFDRFRPTLSFFSFCIKTIHKKHDKKHDQPNFSFHSLKSRPWDPKKLDLAICYTGKITAPYDSI